MSQERFVEFVSADKDDNNRKIVLESQLSNKRQGLRVLRMPPNIATGFVNICRVLPSFTH